MRLQPQNRDEAEGDDAYFAFENDQLILDPSRRRKIARFLGVDQADLQCGSIACPAQYVGRSTVGPMRDMAGEYDHVVRERYDNDDIDRLDGVDAITAEDAKDCWFRAIASLKRGDYGSYTDRPMEAAEKGEEVAREIGWLEEGESVDSDYGVEV